MENELNFENEVKTEPKRKRNKDERTLLVGCVRFRYIGSEPMVLKDTFGVGYTLTPNCEFVVPKGSMEQHCAFRKTSFERLTQ